MRIVKFVFESSFLQQNVSPHGLCDEIDFQLLSIVFTVSQERAVLVRVQFVCNE